ncbi:uncharacterized protein Dana_GF27338, partial [Drosophila ananassae]
TGLDVDDCLEGRPGNYLAKSNCCNFSYRFFPPRFLFGVSLACAIFFGHNCHYGLWSGYIQDLLQYFFSVVSRRLLGDGVGQREDGKGKPQPPSGSADPKDTWG